ncbi:MAG: hypothetical protein HZC19_04190 [Candidatus Omnitrophica bacterium]|nr:hypothetical protein [Candidatus Omnitrophota bacterium]
MKIINFQNRAPRYNEKAFSLPEALISIFILASLILCFILAFTVSKYTTQMSKTRLICINLLRKDMEEILATPYADVDSLAGTQDISINDGMKVMTIRKTIGVTTKDPDIYGYKKIYVAMEWAGGISGIRDLKEEAILYVTKE